MKTLYVLHFGGSMEDHGEITGVFAEDPNRLQKLVDSGDIVYFEEFRVGGPLTTEDYTQVSHTPLMEMDEYKITTIESPVDTYIKYRKDQEIFHIFED
jgi:hypothetical protein